MKSFFCTPPFSTCSDFASETPEGTIFHRCDKSFRETMVGAALTLCQNYYGLMSREERARSDVYAREERGRNQARARGGENKLSMTSVCRSRFWRAATTAIIATRTRAKPPAERAKPLSGQSLRRPMSLRGGTSLRKNIDEHDLGVIIRWGTSLRPHETALGMKRIGF